MLVDSSNKPVASSELIGTAVVAPLRPSELGIARNYCPKRLAEFSCGRACAHEALGMLNRDVHAILPGSRGEPLWPKGVVGSITHCEGYAGAIVALRKGCRSVGIDAEPNVTIGADLFPYVMRGEEMEQVAALSRQNRNNAGISWFLALKKRFTKPGIRSIAHGLIFLKQQSASSPKCIPSTFQTRRYRMVSSLRGLTWTKNVRSTMELGCFRMCTTCF